MFYSAACERLVSVLIGAVLGAVAAAVLAALLVCLCCRCSLAAHSEHKISLGKPTWILWRSRRHDSDAAAHQAVPSKGKLEPAASTASDVDLLGSQVASHIPEAGSKAQQPGNTV